MDSTLFTPQNNHQRCRPFFNSTTVADKYPTLSETHLHLVNLTPICSEKTVLRTVDVNDELLGENENSSKEMARRVAFDTASSNCLLPSIDISSSMDSLAERVMNILNKTHTDKKSEASIASRLYTLTEEQTDLSNSLTKTDRQRTESVQSPTCTSYRAASPISLSGDDLNVANESNSNSNNQIIEKQEPVQHVSRDPCSMLREVDQVLHKLKLLKQKSANVSGENEPFQSDSMETVKQIISPDSIDSVDCVSGDSCPVNESRFPEPSGYLTDKSSLTEYYLPKSELCIPHFDETFQSHVFRVPRSAQNCASLETSSPSSSSEISFKMSSKEYKFFKMVEKHKNDLHRFQTELEKFENDYISRQKGRAPDHKKRRSTKPKRSIKKDCTLSSDPVVAQSSGMTPKSGSSCRQTNLDYCYQANSGSATSLVSSRLQEPTSNRYGNGETHQHNKHTLHEVNTVRCSNQVCLQSNSIQNALERDTVNTDQVYSQNREQMANFNYEQRLCSEVNNISLHDDYCSQMNAFNFYDNLDENNIQMFGTPKWTMDRSMQTSMIADKQPSDSKFISQQKSHGPVSWFVPLDSPKSSTENKVEPFIQHGYNYDLQEAFDKKCYHFQLKSLMRVRRIKDNANLRVNTADQRRRLMAESYVLKQKIDDQQRNIEHRPQIKKWTPKDDSLNCAAQQLPVINRRVFTHKQMRAQTEKVYSRLPEVKAQKINVKKEDEAKRRRLMADIFKTRLKENAVRGKLNWPITGQAVCT